MDACTEELHVTCKKSLRIDGKNTHAWITRKCCRISACHRACHAPLSSQTILLVLGLCTCSLVRIERHRILLSVPLLPRHACTWRLHNTSNKVEHYNVIEWFSYARIQRLRQVQSCWFQSPTNANEPRITHAIHAVFQRASLRLNK